LSSFDHRSSLLCFPRHVLPVSISLKGRFTSIPTHEFHDITATAIRLSDMHRLVSFGSSRRYSLLELIDVDSQLCHLVCKERVCVIEARLEDLCGSISSAIRPGGIHCLLPFFDRYS
jgi:hypothetical protein